MNTMKCGHIITVGTSLITNTGGERNGYTGRSDQLRRLDKVFVTSNGHTVFERPVNGGDITQQRKVVADSILKLKPDQEFGYREQTRSSGPKDRLPQELSYLYAFANHYRNECIESNMVRLLSSNTNDSKNCALVICEVLQGDPWNGWFTAAFDANKDYAEGVDAKHGGQFETVGVHKMMEKIQEMIVELKDKGCARIYLNVTGGYKGTVPYSTLMGMLRRKEHVEIAYLFEDSKRIIFIPAYPIGLDFNEWHENALRLKMVKDYPSTKQYFSPEKPVAALLQEDGSLYPLGQLLEERYDKQLATDPLIIYSRNIIHRLLPEKDAETTGFRESLDKLVGQVGDLIWIGDKIPEMVDHALKHHQHLLEFAELFLTPILKKCPEFMKPKERFCLLAGILLHDCGHSLDYLKSEPLKTGAEAEILLFPSDVRDYHHFLTAKRLDDPENSEKLAWPWRKGQDLHDAVRTVCLYHRRRTGYEEYENDTAKEKAKNHLTDEQLDPLLENEVTLRLNSRGIDLMKVVAFMRLIDGCDNQSRRVGSKEFYEQKKSMLRSDYRTAQRRAEEAVLLYRNMIDILSYAENADLKKLNEAIKEDREDGITHYRYDDKCRTARKKCLDLLKNEDPKLKQLAHLWQIAAELVDRADMKLKQEDHYLKHLCVEEVLVIPRAIEPDAPGKFEFDVVLKKNNNYSEALEKEITEEGKTQSRKAFIEHEISSEYKSVQRYASLKFGLSVYYWWKDDYNQRGEPFFPKPTE